LALAFVGPPSGGSRRSPRPSPPRRSSAKAILAEKWRPKRKGKAKRKAAAGQAADAPKPKGGAKDAA
jgi:hypothetical protein